MDNRSEPFTPETVDERVDQLLRDQRHSADSTQDARLVHSLHRLYNEYAGTRERVWKRLAEHMSDHSPTQQAGAGTIQLKRQKRQPERYHDMKQETLYPKMSLGLVIAAVITALLVGSMAWVFAQTHSSHNTKTALPGQYTAQNAQNRPVPGVYAGTQTTVERVDLQSGKILWTFTLPDLTQIPSSERSEWTVIEKIIPDGNSLYIAVISSTDLYSSRIIALDAAGGRMLWQYKFDGRRVFWLDMAVANGKVYSSVTIEHPTQSGFLYVLNAARGKQEAKYALPEAVNDITIVDGTLYASLKHGLYALDLASGNQLWHTPIRNYALFISRPHVVNGTLYTELINDTTHPYSYIAAYNAKNGANEWTSPRIASVVSDLTIASNAIYFGSFTGTLYAYDTQHGKQLWSLTTQGVITQAPAVANNVVYAPVSLKGVNFEIVAVNASDGRMRWLGEAGAVIDSTLTVPCVVHNMLYVASGFEPASIYAFNVANGSQVWKTPLGVSALSLIAVG